MPRPAAFCAPAPATARLTAPTASISFRPQLRRTIARSRVSFDTPLQASLAGLPYYGPPQQPVFALPTGPPPPGDDYVSGRGDGDDGPGPNGKALLAAMSVLFARYSALLVSAPVRTKAITTGLLMLLADYLAQSLTQPGVEVARLLRFLAYGLLIAGPATHAWYVLMDRAVRVPGLTGTAVKVALDQLVVNHAFIACFFSFMTLFESGSADGVPARLQSDHMPAFLASLRVWPLVNMINFSLVSPEFRVVVGSAVNVGWITYLSISAAASKPANQPVVEIAATGA